MTLRAFRALAADPQLTSRSLLGRSYIDVTDAGTFPHDDHGPVFLGAARRGRGDAWMTREQRGLKPLEVVRGR